MRKDMQNTIDKKKLERYFSITKKALDIAKKKINKRKKKEAEIILDTAQRYYDDALWFKNKGDSVNSFACLNYGHGWLDAGAKLGIFLVKEYLLFEEENK